MTRSEMDSPFFIVGPGRSGTTLLRSLLSAHSRLVVAPETHFMKNANTFSGSRSLDTVPVETFWRYYQQTRQFATLDVDPTRCETPMKAHDEFGYGDLFAELLRAYGERVGKPRVGEKTPNHVRYLPQLFDWFPTTHVIATRRDPRAVIASQLKSPWVTKLIEARSLRYGMVEGTRLYQIAYWAQDWHDIYTQILPRWEQDKRMLMVSYEGLVTDPEQELRQICDFLGERFEGGMLDERSTKTVPPIAAAGAPKDERWRAWSAEHHAKTLSPISADSLERWREELSATEIAVIESICGEPMRHAGYSPVTPPTKRMVGHLTGSAITGLAQSELSARALAKRLLKPSNRVNPSPAG